ncbi:histidinol-phosphate transaminase [Novosphingobium sediminicola]|uniref:Histidinol-phosphate aminotransferase n=1 Tax=Novosphingobium sediminicola TaxID=563162 RepID=A0A7W6CKJ2_9SPHN|nr:histidinol-phosphate transaminase [Novosphingobium sediminicola]MBB3957150.1 histidinol-phosphate aminotransferase [Novosphingobium sediminicola]
MSQFWSPLVHRLSPYVPGEQPRVEGLIKLNTNELPFGPSPAVAGAIEAAAREGLQLYPDPQSGALCEALAAYHGMPRDHVFVGNGSDEVLAHAFAGLLKHDGQLLFPDITYSFYPTYCRLFGIAYETVPLDGAMQVNIEDYRRATGAIVGAVILPNPNAPTGVGLGLDAVERLLAMHAHAPVVIDEAYVDFGAQSALPLIARYPNLLIVRTLSKSRGLAGLRVGYALGQPHLIEALVRVKDSFNSYPLDRLAQAGALASLGDEDYFQQGCAAIIENRAQLVTGLERLGFAVLPSQANFVFARHSARGGAELAQALRAKKILVRHFNAPRIDPFLRITVGNGDQVSVLLQALEDILSC